MAKVIKNILGNFLLFCLIFIIVAAWLFSGWPQIWDYPAIPPQIGMVFAAQFARPSSDVDVGSPAWTDEGGGSTNIYQSIDEYDAGVDADYIKSNPNADLNPYVAGLGTISDPQSSTGHVIRWRAKRDKTNKTLTLVVSLYEGDTHEVASSSISDTALDSFTTSTYTLTAGQADSIASYADLRLQFNITVNGGAGQFVYVSWAEFEVPDAPVASVYVKDGTIGYGFVAVGGGACSTTTTDTQYAINNGGFTENFNIKSTDTTNWDIGTSSPGSEIYTHLFTTTSGSYWQYIDNEYVSLETGVLDNGTSTIDTYIFLPSATVNYGEQSTTITIQAVAQ